MKKNMQEAMEKLAEVGLQGGEEEKGSVEEINREMEAATDIVIEMEEMIDQLSDKEIELNQELEDRRTPKREMKEEEEESDLQGITGQIQPRVQLPPSRIPAFSGKSWDWENFWQLFEHNIHNQPVSEVIKFNFLLDAVPAEIKETIGRFRISREGYDEAINWLKRHYERDDIIIEQLYTKLETTQNTGNSTAEQRRLFNQIATTVTQLRNKGQDVNHRQLLTQITRKFEERIQEKIIAKKAELIQSNLWNWDSLREVVEDALSRRELIEEMRELERRRGEPRENPTQGIRKAAPREKGPACLYCKRTNHPARECRAVPENERISFFKRNNLCLNCGRNNHRVAECWSQNCRRCGRKHHISLCGIRSETTSATQPRMENEQQTQAPPPTPTNKGSTSQRRSQRGQRQGENAGHSVQNLVESEQEHEDHVGKRRPRKEKSKKEEKKKKEHKKEAQPNRKTTHLLSGTVQIRGPYESREVGILLDTGSELSFIDSKLADDLKLPVLAKKTLRINTFGSNETKQDDYEQIQVEVNGEKDNTHSLRLFKSNIIIKASPQANLQREDWRFMKDQGIQMPYRRKQTAPQILLGCDQLWEIMSGSMMKLPSGLHLIATKFGHMVSGKPSTKEETEPITIALSTEDERDKWDSYWALESSGTQEYTGTQRQEKEETNRRVLENFIRTVQKREDGYYVRLPWKEGHEPLPDNRYIAERRLRSTFESHKEDKAFLQEYDKIFKDQVEKGILEEVKNPRIGGKRMHYLAHQAVLTPKKTTTKMRIVFDASAHYKGKPSLNDTLHQGPLILPKIIGMIMRFRLGKIATISDVEKAFLQVRLQEEDRDATRCLWVRDINKPLSTKNIIVYRFTRVTFGLKSSPFLLAATIKFHADNEEVGKEVAEDINKNLYVDNLFMTAESTEQALEKYEEAKTLFNKLKMNLREFTSNDEEFNKRIKEEDRSQETNPSTLGVTWNTEEDKFIIKYRPLELPKITKRTVLRNIASIYDPMGYLIPLTLQQKIFFQKLWTKNYTWDNKLTQEDIANWNRIRSKASEFEKRVPRRIADKAATHQLVVCTDASNEAMCAVVYLRNKESQNILIAKSRLPALRTKHTIPKLELNALTMGARLSINTATELKGQIKIDRIFILSDSEIALSWVKNCTAHTDKGMLVKNRCKEIAEISENLAKQGTPVHFGHINTKFNPADLGTRPHPAHMY